MIEGIKNLFYSIFKLPRKSGDKRSSATDLSDNEEPPPLKRSRCSYDAMEGEADTTGPKPGVFRILESQEFKNPLVGKWSHSTGMFSGSNYTPTLPAQGITRSRDVIRNKENAKGRLAILRTSTSRTHPIVIDLEDDSDAEGIKSPRNQYRSSNLPPVPRVRIDNTFSGVSPTSGAVRKPLRAQRKVPIVTVAESDDEIQIVERPAWPPKSTTCMHFASNPYILTDRSTTRFRPSEAHKRDFTSFKSPLVPQVKTFGEVSRQCTQGYALEKKQFEELISRYRNGCNFNRFCTSKKPESKVHEVPVYTIDGDVAGKEVVDVQSNRAVKPTTLATKIAEGLKVVESQQLPGNSLEDTFLKSKYYSSQLVKNVKEKYRQRALETEEKCKEPTITSERLAKYNAVTKAKIDENLRRNLARLEIVLKDEALEAVPQLPVLTPAMQKIINLALIPGPKSDLLVDAFSLRITRHDMQTLSGLNWLNDEVINFYMNLLIERGKEKKYPSVYAHNTFFYPRILQGGYAAVKRWTRKIDLFAHDLIIVPVHLGVHWCMASIDMRNKEIRYFDSMGNKNNKCLKQLLDYLVEELKDKKKQMLDTKDWTLVNTEDIPQQGNGSDCGMFACMYAEYICRDSKITFTQDDMPYFRQKMVYEIISKKLLPIPE